VHLLNRRGIRNFGSITGGTYEAIGYEEAVFLGDAGEGRRKKGGGGRLMRVVQVAEGRKTSY